MPKCKNKKQSKTKTRKQWSLLCVGPLSLTQGFLWSIVNMSNNNPLTKMRLSLLAVLVRGGASRPLPPLSASHISPAVS